MCSIDEDTQRTTFNSIEVLEAAQGSSAFRAQILKDWEI